MPVGNGNYVASKFSPEGYPSDLYSASFYIPNSQTGTVLVYVWDDDGDNGTILLFKSGFGTASKLEKHI